MKLRQLLTIAPLAVGLAYACGDDKKGGEEAKPAATEQEARPEITNAEVSNYQVNGNTCENVEKDIFDAKSGKGFLIGGKRRAGKAEMELGFTCSYEPKPEQQDKREYCCKAVIENLDAFCNATVHLPQWSGSDKCWDKFIDGVKAHEQGHVNICMDYKDRLKNAISPLESRICSTESMEKACNDALDDLESKANSQEKAIDKEHNAAQDRYDSETNHGETQGAVLDCSCK